MPTRKGGAPKKIAKGIMLGPAKRATAPFGKVGD